MPAFSGQFSWQDGLIWKVGFLATADKELPQADRIHLCPALVDTGASHTCISSSVANKLRLEPKGKIDMQTARGIEAVNVYDVQPAMILMGMPDLEGKSKRTIQVFSPIHAPEFDPVDKNYKALIGRDILRQGVLTMSFDGHYTFAY